MTRPVLWLIGVTGGVWLVAALPISLISAQSASAILVSATAGLLCLIPALATLLLALRSAQRPPEERVVAVLGSVVIRMIVILGGGVVLYFSFPVFRDQRWVLLTWGLIFYLTTLAVETAMVMASLKRAAPSALDSTESERSQSNG